jgi:hypothetical protein
LISEITGELISGENYQKFMTLHEAYAGAYNSLYNLVKGMAGIANARNTALHNLHLKCDEETGKIITQLASALDTERYGWLGFNGSIFTDIKSQVRQYRAAIEFYRLTQKIVT